MQHTITGEAALGALRPMPDGPKGRFNGIRGTQTLPMLCRVIIEYQQLLAVFLETQRGLGVFGFIGLDK